MIIFDMLVKETDKREEIYCHVVYIFAVSKRLAIIGFKVENCLLHLRILEEGTLLPSVTSGKVCHVSSS